MQTRNRTLEAVLYRGAVGVALLVLLALLYSLWGVVHAYLGADQKALEAETQLAALKERKASLEQSLAKLDTKRGQEEEVRNRLGLVRPNETEFVLIDSATSSVDNAAPARESIWSAFWSLFKSRD